ncbi:MAG: sporulation inhibitor of replication protein SirA [Bacilli bacterium]|nr:sporulation inhibitor of replication protein SirA [Bacilli bacterium]
MYKYYLFIIKNNAYKIYKNNSDYLFNILNTLYHLKGSDLNYGINLYKTICDIFSVKLLNNYINERFYIEKKDDKIYLKNKTEKTYLKINYSTTIIKTNKKMPEIFRIFNIYNKKIFIIDFKRKKYFWLNDQIIKTKLTKKK